MCLSSAMRTTHRDEAVETNFDLKRESFSLIIPPSEYRQRQVRLVDLVRKKIGERQSCLLVVAAANRLYQADTKIPVTNYKQNAEFLYLTGLNTYEASGSILIILGGENEQNAILFAPQMASSQIVWEGLGLMSSEYVNWIEQIGCEVKDAQHVEQFVRDNLSDRHLFVAKSSVTLNKTDANNNVPSALLASSKSLSPILDELRLNKSDNELLAMKRTCAIGANAMRSTMAWTADQTVRNSSEFNMPLVKESQIEAKFDFESRLNGAIKPAYPAVCAGANRSTVIHYGANNLFLSVDDWVNQLRNQHRN